jgi:Gluconate 2-dehydrogenase subunit 3
MFVTTTRRRAILTALAAGLTGPALVSALEAAEESVDAETLAAYLDTLLPADAVSPSASQLGIGAEMLDIAATVPLFSKLLALGTAWLNKTGRGPFHALASQDQARVVAWMNAADRDQIPGRFYLLVRQTAVELYYSRPEITVGFDLNPAPQPAGYPPPWQ